MTAISLRSASPADGDAGPIPRDEPAEGRAMARQRLGVILLTFNSAAVIERTVNAALALTPTVTAVDSGSTDETVELLRGLGCRVVQRPFKHYADQRNWAIDRFGTETEWQLHLDADEVLDPLAIAEIRRALDTPGGSTGFILERRTYFLGRALRHGGTTNYHLRLFKSGTARCEDRLYDQHFVADRPATRLRGVLHDLNVGTLDEWTARHNRWSTLEAEELSRPPASREQQIRARLSADPRERRRYYKQRYYRAPRLWRAGLLFVWRYVFQAGFLDGREGFLYAFLQVFWFRTLVDAKLVEREARH